MRYEDALAVTAGTPHMTARQSRTIHDFFLEHRPVNVLELGFAHGTSTCHFAAALDELGGDRTITTIDRPAAMERAPNITEMLNKCGLAHLVNVILEPTSYTWTLLRMLDQTPQPRFDFAYIDGAHLWDVDGFAFTLVDRLLVPGGWVLFDDLDWTLAKSPSLADAPWVRALPAEQRETPQVRKVFELLVRTHPGYDEFIDEDGWGWARKRPNPTGPTILVDADSDTILGTATPEQVTEYEQANGRPISVDGYLVHLQQAPAVDD